MAGMAVSGLQSLRDEAGGGDMTDLPFDGGGFRGLPIIRRAPQPAAPAPAAGGNPFLPTAGQLQGFAPQPYQAFGDVPTLTPTYMQAGQVGNTQMPGGMGLFEAQLMQSMLPMFGEQRQQQDADMASRGIFNSGAAQQAGNDLAGQQAAAIAGPLGQLTQQGMGLYGQGVLQNASNQQGANEFNAGAANTANATNAGTYGSITANNEANYNAFLQQLMQAGMGTSGSLMNSYLGTYGPDPSVGGLYSQGLSGAGSAYSNALNAGESNAANLSNLFGNAGAAFGQSMNKAPAGPPAGWNGFGMPNLAHPGP